MKRFIDLYLQNWINDPLRKPILLRGARQVGKTFAVRQLGTHFKQFIEINFEKLPELKKIFELDLDPKRIVRDLSAILKKEIIPSETLLFFDEIQQAPNVITALRYFYEEMPKLHVIAAGSLLDFAIQKVGVPVGRVSFLYMYPMSWLEFLQAQGNQILINEILKHPPSTPMNEPIHEHTLGILSEYLAVGGMPEAVSAWIEGKNPNASARVHQTIIETYRQDFHKYAKEHQVKYVELVYENAVKQLGGKFKFSAIPGDFRKRELSPALDLLATAGVFHKIYHSSGQGLPIGAQTDLEKFKVIFLDVGLTQAILGLNFSDWLLNTKNSYINKGALLETFVGQELLVYSDPHVKYALHYWQKEDRGASAEIDYLIQKQGQVIPIEVKSSKGTQLKSMHYFLKTHPLSKYGFRFSSHDYSIHENIYSYPLYAIAKALDFNF